MIRTTIARYRRATRAQRRIALEAAASLVISALAIRLFGFARCHRALGRLPVSALSNALPVEDVQLSVARLVELIHNVAKGLRIGSDCLTRSLAVLWVLSRRGIAAELCIGARIRDGNLEAHAWVEHRGSPLGERLGVRKQFSKFERIRTGYVSAPG